MYTTMIRACNSKGKDSLKFVCKYPSFCRMFLKPTCSIILFLLMILTIPILKWGPDQTLVWRGYLYNTAFPLIPGRCRRVDNAGMDKTETLNYFMDKFGSPVISEEREVSSFGCGLKYMQDLHCFTIEAKIQMSNLTLSTLKLTAKCFLNYCYF